MYINTLPSRYEGSLIYSVNVSHESGQSYLEVL